MFINWLSRSSRQMRTRRVMPLGPGGRRSLWIGAVIGCLFGTLVLRLVSDDDEHTFNENLAACGIVGGYGAVGGLVVGLVAP